MGAWPIGCLDTVSFFLLWLTEHIKNLAKHTFCKRSHPTVLMIKCVAYFQFGTNTLTLFHLFTSSMAFRKCSFHKMFYLTVRRFKLWT